MPLHFSAAHSSRVSKKPQHKIPSLRRSATSPFASLGRRKPLQRSHSKPEVTDREDFFKDKLDDVGLVNSLATDLSLRDVSQTLRYILSHRFDDIPSAGGFNSVRIAEILNFRKNLPPTVTTAHVHALLRSPSTTEREIAELIKNGVIKRIVVSGRGSGGSSVETSLAFSEQIEILLKQTNGLDQATAGNLHLPGGRISLIHSPEKLIRHLRENIGPQHISPRDFKRCEISALMNACFLISAPDSVSDFRASQPDLSNHTLTKSTSMSTISKAAAGSVAANGGAGAFHEAGGYGAIRHSNPHLTEQQRTHDMVGEVFQLSLPNMGPHLKLLTSSRTHLISLITKSRFREMPVYLLKERWDGGVASDDPAAKAKRYRGEFTGILPSQT